MKPWFHWGCGDSVVLSLSSGNRSKEHLETGPLMELFPLLFSTPFAWMGKAFFFFKANVLQISRDDADLKDSVFFLQVLRYLVPKYMVRAERDLKINRSSLNRDIEPRSTISYCVILARCLLSHTRSDQVELNKQGIRCLPNLTFWRQNFGLWTSRNIPRYAA